MIQLNNFVQVSYLSFKNNHYNKKNKKKKYFKTAFNFVIHVQKKIIVLHVKEIELMEIVFVLPILKLIPVIKFVLVNIKKLNNYFLFNILILFFI